MLQIVYDDTFLAKDPFSGDTSAAESWIDTSLEAEKQYFKDNIFVTNLAIERIGNTEHAHTSISISDIKLGKLLDRTLESKGNAHIVVYHVGEHLKLNGKTRMGQAGCLGCICRPYRLSEIESKSSLEPHYGYETNYKHVIVAKTQKEETQGKVRKLKDDNLISRTGRF